MDHAKAILRQRNRRRHRVRKPLRGTSERPRLTVRRSHKHIYAQVIDDVKGVTITSASSHVKDSAQKVNKTDQAKLIGKEIAENASKAGIKEVVFDRNGYLYHGRVKALAESARENGLKF